AGRRARTTRSLARGTGVLALLILPQIVALHVLLHFAGPGLHPKAILNTLRQVVPTLVVILVAGVALRCAYEAWRGGERRFLSDIATPQWIAASGVLVLCGGLTVHAYCYLKLMVPLVHPRMFDGALWTLDRWLLFGLSPNVFLLTLFAEPALLRAIDWMYAFLYYPVLLAFLAFFLSLRSNRLRFAMASGFAGLWLVGSWLYVLVPSLGPAYHFSALWDASREFLPISHLTQVRLMDNYTKVLRIPEGMSPSAINAAMGIAAFPSLHVASQLYVALWTRRLVPRLGFLLLLTVGAFYVGSVVTGWHYMIDSVAGLLMAWAAYVITTRAWGLSGWRKRAPARPLPRRRGGA
ncbi:MAG TPA: phosphatase PAP2 family protein, partial [Thermoanaerobaculia bacterium]|nr:phosphatase PAP2 family protein [Thermoanaerobaculia bacterium]